MKERAWAWTVWILWFLIAVAAAVPTLGFTLIFLVPWWIGGPFYVTKDCEIAPWWDPPRPRKLRWRHLR